jgi:TRAP-type mannitol/chloroaromatic compound transport system permease large subunit
MIKDMISLYKDNMFLVQHLLLVAVQPIPVLKGNADIETAMLNRKYDKRIALGCICAGGTLGILIPPSVITVVYAVTAGVSIGRMFMGGVGPGLLLSALFITYIAVCCWLRPEFGPAPSKQERKEYSFKVKLIALRAVIAPILLIIGVLGAIYVGIATPTEAAGVGCVGAIISGR